jgi:hypothetical protein
VGASRRPTSLVGAEEAKDLARCCFDWCRNLVILKNLERFKQWVAMPWKSAAQTRACRVVRLLGGRGGHQFVNRKI